MRVSWKGREIWSGKELRFAVLWREWPQYIPLKIDGKVTLINKSELTVE